jgi:hypothetical protein
VLPASSTFAQEPGEITQLQSSLRTQQELNRKLLERLDALEAGQAALLSKLQAVETSIPDNGELHEEREAILDELRDEYFDLQDRLDSMPTITGYYDFEYFNDNRQDSPGEFRHHRLSVFVTKEWEQWRLFSEFEFEYGAKFEGVGGTDIENSRGEIKIEQSWGEYVHSNELTLRGGLILTPGYWNVNHYPNVVLTTRPPLMMRNVFRESFVGLMAYGTKYWDKFGVTYRGYVGNGQSPAFARRDDNEGKAVGGRVTLHLPTEEILDVFDVGLSAYHESPKDVDRTMTWGADLQLRKGPWEVLSEFAMRDAEEDRTGFYMQPSYRFNEKLAAFYRFDLLDIVHAGETREHTIGVNYRPIPDISLKLEYFHSYRSRDEDSSGVAASVAIRF